MLRYSGRTRPAVEGLSDEVVALINTALHGACASATAARRAPIALRLYDDAGEVTRAPAPSTVDTH